MAATYTGIQNENEFYGHHHLSELFAKDIQDTAARWRRSPSGAEQDEGGPRPPDQTLRALDGESELVLRRAPAMGPPE